MPTGTPWTEAFSAHPTGEHLYLLVAAFIFCLGITACMVRRNALGILIGIELILNAAILNFMTFWFFRGGMDQDGRLSGPVMGVFIIVMAACEAAIALAILINMYRTFGTVSVDKVRLMRK
jgi:NADH-quinone oxidoreductase subunit K